MIQEMNLTNSRPYPEMEREIEALLEKESDCTANLANIAAVLYWGLTDVNWLGFYLWNGDELVLGPFHGKSATSRIRSGNGVCGVAFARREVQRVEDVLNFPGHIPWDFSSQSEIVIPLMKDGKCFGVLDVDSPILARFSLEDQAGLEQIATEIMAHAMWKERIAD